jgi:3-hydroxybutyryl-CoA dehydrogenase
MPCRIGFYVIQAGKRKNIRMRFDKVRGMKISRVCVVGGGTMGNGIAHVFALCGYEVVVVETTQSLADRALAVIAQNMKRQCDKGHISAQDQSAALACLSSALSIEKAGPFQLAIEAVSENIDLKKNIFKSLDQSAHPQAILATNTSSLSVTEIGSVVKDSSRVIGMHFMNPVPVMKLVELIGGLQTSEETFKTTEQVVEKLGKVAARAKDYPGFISNRILMPMINEAILCLQHMILPDITKSAYFVVKRATTADQRFFKKIYLNFGNELVVPFSFKIFVPAMQIDNVQNSLLGNIVIYAKNLFFFEKLTQKRIQSFGSAQIITKRFFYENSGKTILSSARNSQSRFRNMSGQSFVQ